jgi:hypothetical protein
MRERGAEEKNSKLAARRKIGRNRRINRRRNQHGQTTSLCLSSGFWRNFPSVNTHWNLSATPIGFAHL